ncbi:MAG TPA: four helix bundle protein [Ignavibacteriaceae bacterium]|nr:four helix bundle protein [Ignavibacteriaceae bacterium]
MQKSKQFTELIVWQKAHQFVLEVYKLTKGFPKEELFGLTSQFRRAAVSIPANIAEGYRKRGKNDKVRFFNISEGSLEECKYYLKLSKDLGYVNDINLINSAEEISKLLDSYSKAILASVS